MTPLCPYCGNEPELVNGAAIYPRRPDVASRAFYLCTPCGAHVGCHPGTINPLGRLADLELRKAKVAAHAAFDPLWRSGGMKRVEAYRWLAGVLGLPKSECHIGLFDVSQCSAVVAATKERAACSS